MLFIDPVFLFVYLPAVLGGYYALCRASRPRAAVWWLLLASVAFYVYDDVARLLPLIAVSIGFNYGAGILLHRKPSRGLLAAAVGGNLLLLGYFKYAGFIAGNVAALAGLGEPTLAVVLPIGISFYTFTQIAFLVDVYRGQGARYRFADYALFVTLFPHLVAGPILRHDDTIPQLARAGTRSIARGAIAAGWTWFSLGFAKKVLLADGVAPYADAVFDAAARQQALSASDAWAGTAAYALQLYFDFSGYSDMAIGLALMAGIAFPLNFDSPYKASSLIDFWRRWHMTLSAFLRDYLYIPLGGNRRGRLRRYTNLMVTMVLGGLWHGAAWTFVAWGALHGAGLVGNHLLRRVLGPGGGRLRRGAGRVATLSFVLAAWVPFRAESMEAAARVWLAMAGRPIAPPAVPGAGVEAWIWIAALGAIALAAPNTQALLGAPAARLARPTPSPEQDATRGLDVPQPSPGPASPSRLRWQPTPMWAVGSGMLIGLSIARAISQPTSFLYFRF